VASTAGYPHEAVAADADSCHRLLSLLDRHATRRQRADAVSTLIAVPQVFDPASVLVPALRSLQAENGFNTGVDAQHLRLWRHCSAFLLTRSEFPPPAPRDWSQPVALSCRCDDCRALESFARDPRLREHRFRVRKDRRQHLHHQIGRNGLDMTHVTERMGSPQTLVCRKTRERYQRQCSRHAEDVDAMRALLALGNAAPGEDCARLAAATAREPRAEESRLTARRPKGSEPRC
jgi:hypothetical protein